jgi:hypothetical protein
MITSSIPSIFDARDLLIMEVGRAGEWESGRWAEREVGRAGWG